MIRVFDSDQVFLTSNNTKENINKLDLLIVELKEYISQINNYYRGEDASEIVYKYNEIVKNLEVINDNFANCQKFLSIVSGRYSDNFKRAKTNMQSLNDALVPEEVNLENNGLEFNPIGSELVDGEQIIENEVVDTAIVNNIL